MRLNILKNKRGDIPIWIFITLALIGISSIFIFSMTNDQIPEGLKSLKFARNFIH